MLNYSSDPSTILWYVGRFSIHESTINIQVKWILPILRQRRCQGLSKFSGRGEGILHFGMCVGGGLEILKTTYC